MQTYTYGKDVRVIVWGCFWDDGRTRAYLIDRDFEARRMGTPPTVILRFWMQKLGQYIKQIITQATY
jgi:hypothetical protein